MKATGKNIGRLIVGCAFACCLSLFTLQAFAIEGLKISVQSTNAVLSWPSTNIETYMVQYRSNLNVGSTWLTLADNLSAATGSNVTYFSHSPASTNRTGFYRIVRDGAHLFGITNGMPLSGVVTIPVEVANPSGSLVNLSLTENEAPVNGAVSLAAPIGAPLQVTLDTTMMVNGVHQLSASACWMDTNGNIWEADSPPVSVNIYNEISFAYWMPRFGELGNTMLIWAQSAHTTATWTIDVYDSSNVYVGTFGGQTDADGNIGGTWNMVGPGGIYHPDPTFTFIVTTHFDTGSSATPNYSGGTTPYSSSMTNMLTMSSGPTPNLAGSASAKAPKIWRVTDNWVSPGAWVAALQHAFDYLSDSDTLYSELTGYVGLAGMGGDAVLPAPDGNGNPFALTFQSPGEADAWTSFKSALWDPRARNLVYFGHGGPNNLGYNWGNPNISLSAAEIANHLHTMPDTQTNRHGFRFVMLDGCSTAQGTLPEAFGIMHQENLPIDPYAAASIRPSAFAGWDKDMRIAWLGGEFYDHVKFIQEIQIHMDPSIYSEGIHSAIHSAANALDVQEPYYETHFKVFGFGDLHFFQYN
jgi:hypothetical protein